MIDSQEQQQVGTCPLTLSRVSSSYSQLSLVRICSYNSNSQQDIHRATHQRFLKLDTIFQSIEKLCGELQELLVLDKDLILLLLGKYGWRVDRLKEGYYGGEEEGWREMQGRKEGWRKRGEGGGNQERRECYLCKEITLLVHNVCGHSCCHSCWLSYLLHQLPLPTPFPLCPFQQCPSPLFHSFILSLLPPSHHHFYLKTLTLSYIQNTKSLTFCPGPNCDYCFQDTSCLSKNVICTNCKQGFCFKCGREAHEPCSCKEAEEWAGVVRKEGCSEGWIRENTRRCPHCKQAVEKTVGCDFILCKCRRKFCYRCGRDWEQGHSSHYQCPYEGEGERKEGGGGGKVGQVMAPEIQMLNKYLFDFLSLDSQIKSVKSYPFDLLRNKIITHIQLSESELIFLSKTKDTLIKTSYILKWGLIFGYFNIGKREMNQKYMRGLNGDVGACMGLLREMEGKLGKGGVGLGKGIGFGMGMGEFLGVQMSGAKVKEFYKEKGRVEGLVTGLEEGIRGYLRTIGRE